MTRRLRGRRRRSEYLETVPLPREVEAVAGDGLVVAGLRDWLHVCLIGAPSRFVTLPSWGVARAWAALVGTPTWTEIVDRAFGGDDLRPASVERLPDAEQRDGLWRTWHIACRREGIAGPAPDRLPRLFDLDRRLPAGGDGAEWAVHDGDPPFRLVAGRLPTTACVVGPSPDEAQIYAPWGVPPDGGGPPRGA